MRCCLQCILLFAFIGYTGLVPAQETIQKSNLSVGMGKPIHPDMDINKEGLLLSNTYRRNISRVFNWGVVLLRSSADSQLGFYMDKAAMLKYLNDGEYQSGIGTTWGKIETLAAGAQLYLNFANTRRHFFSMGTGLGYYTSSSSLQSLVRVREDFIYSRTGEFINSEISEVEVEVTSETRKAFFFLPALQYQYSLFDHLFIGVEVNLFLDLDSTPLTTHPVQANFYSFSVQLGARF